MAVALGPSTFEMVGEASSVGTRWKRWKKGFQYYMDARGIMQEKQAKALLLHSAGMDVQNIFEDLTDLGHGPRPTQCVRKSAPYSRRLFSAVHQ